MEKLEKQTHKLFIIRHIRDNPSIVEQKCYCLAGSADPLKFFDQPYKQADNIASLAKELYFPLGPPRIDLYDGITTLERPKILPGHTAIIEPVSAEELVEFLREFNKLQYKDKSKE